MSTPWNITYWFWFYLYFNWFYKEWLAPCPTPKLVIIKIFTATLNMWRQSSSLQSEDVLCYGDRNPINTNSATVYFWSVAEFKYFGMTLTNQIVFMKRLTRDLSLGTSASIQYRIFAFPWPCKSTQIKCIIYVIFINCNWVVTWWQYTFTHKQYVEHK
jgi:hypothetical protein